MSLSRTLHRRKSPLRLATAGLLAASLLTEAIGALPHATAGLLFALAATAHTAANARWIRGVARRAPRGLPRRTAVDAVVAAVLLVLLAAVTVTGLAALGESGGAAREAHGELATLLVVATVVHAVRHRRRRRVVRGAPGPRPAALSGRRAGG